MAAKKGPAPLPDSVSMSHTHRLKIQNSNILNCLIQHAIGEREMTATQVSAGLGLLKKALPDLQSVAISGGEDAEGNPKEIVIRVVKPRD